MKKNELTINGGVMKKLSVKNINDEKKYFIIFFSFLSLYNFIFTNHLSPFTVGKVAYTAHIMDFSFGFCTKLLVGGINSIFIKNHNPLYYTITETVLLFAVFALISFCLSRMLSLYENKDERRAFLVLSIFFLSGPCTFAIFCDELGLYDVYWLYICVLFFLFLRNKVLRFVIPVLLFGAVMLNFASLFCYIPMFFLVMLYESLEIQDKVSKRLILLILFLSIVTVIGIGVYMLMFERDNLVYKTIEEFNNAAYQKSFYGKDTEITYYDMSFFDWSENFETLLNETLLNEYKPIFKGVEDYTILRALPKTFKILAEALLSRLNYTGFLYFANKKAFFNAIYVFFMMLPIYILLFRFWVFKIKNDNNRIKKLIFLGMLLLLFDIIPLLTFALDIVRMYTHSFLSQCFMILYLINKDKSNIDFFTNIFKSCNKSFLFTYYLIYSLSYFYPFY